MHFNNTMKQKAIIKPHGAPFVIVFAWRRVKFDETFNQKNLKCYVNCLILQRKVNAYLTLGG